MTDRISTPPEVKPGSQSGISARAYFALAVLVGANLLNLPSQIGLYLGSIGVAGSIGGQLRVLWEEILERFAHVEVLEEPTRTRYNFVRGYTRMPVRLRAR